MQAVKRKFGRMLMFLSFLAVCGALGFAIYALNNLGGTTAASQNDSACNENYVPCVPIASDVDCLKGRGNGPEYVSGQCV